MESKSNDDSPKLRKQQPNKEWKRKICNNPRLESRAELFFLLPNIALEFKKKKNKIKQTITI